jgi:hypothetical protein
MNRFERCSVNTQAFQSKLFDCKIALKFKTKYIYRNIFYLFKLLINQLRLRA